MAITYTHDLGSAWLTAARDAGDNKTAATARAAIDGDLEAQAEIVRCESRQSPPDPEDILGDPTDHRVPRDGDLDLALRGWLLGEGKWADGAGHRNRGDESRSVTTRIYLTTGGQYVLSVVYWTRGQDDRSEAWTFAVPHGVINTLRDTSGGQLTRSGKSAWVAACATWTPLAALGVERLD